MKTGWKSWDCSAWGREGFSETLEPPKRGCKKAGEGFFQGLIVREQGGIKGFKMKEGRFRLAVRLVRH